jgi:two-component system, NarL family, sensor histidine kinase UhpB
MTLRFRLIVLVLGALATSVAIGCSVSLLNASRSVQTEMRAALLVGRQTVGNAIKQIETSPNPRRHLHDLVSSFRGNRHLMVSVTGADGVAEVQPVEERPLVGRVPRWFVALLQAKPELDEESVAIDGHTTAQVIIKTDPRNEILEVWDELSSGFVVLALFAGATIPLIYLLVGRALHPLDRLIAAMEQVGSGDYRIRLSDRLTSELARLRDSFNRMTERLADADSENRRLNAQLLNLQDEERSAIAHDLHDEIGPFLLAINADLHAIRQLLGDDAPALSTLLQSIVDAVEHLQYEVRGMLRRLGPIGLGEVGVDEAARGAHRVLTAPISSN